MRDPDKMSRKELVAEYRHLAREQDEYEAKLTEAQERITSLEDKIRRQREALRVLNEAQARITSQLDLEAARRAAEMVQTLKHEPGKAAVELAVARERIAELEALLNDHGPNGRNVTNAQHAALRERIAKLEAVAGAAWTVADDPLGKGEVQMRRMTGAFPAGCKTSRKAVAGMLDIVTPSTAHMSPSKRRNGIRQMREDLKQLAEWDGCIAAAWALEAIEVLARERDTLRAKLDEVLGEQLRQAEAKLATRPAEAVVGELEGKVRKLADILRSLVDLQEGPPLPSTAPVWELVMDEAFDALKEVEGGA